MRFEVVEANMLAMELRWEITLRIDQSIQSIQHFIKMSNQQSKIHKYAIYSDIKQRSSWKQRMFDPLMNDFPVN